MSIPSFPALRGPLVDPKTGLPSREFIKKLQEWEAKLFQTISLVGEIAAATKIAGRTEGIGTTVGKIDSGGIVTATGVDFSRSYTNKTLTNVPDGATRLAVDPNRYTGANRAYNALDSNNQLAGSFKNNPLNTQAAYTGANPLTATTGGAANQATISIASSTQQFGDGQVTYNSGSITPLLDSTLYYIYADDPTFAGGAVTYQATISKSVTVANSGRVYFGQITTPAFGGGGTGGSGGGGGCPLSGAPVTLFGDPSWWHKTIMHCEDFIEIVTESGRKGTFSRHHRSYSNRGTLPLNLWCIGDLALTEDGEERVISLKSVHIPGATVDSYSALKGHVYSAWGFIGHNKFLA